MSPVDGGGGQTDAVTAMFDEVTVLFVTNFDDIKSNLAASLPNVNTTFAATPAEAYAAFDETTAVVCLFDNLLDEAFEQFRTDVLVRHPFCQFLVIESQPLANELVNDYDVILNAPVSGPQLRAVLRRRIIYATYSMTLQEYYHLNARVAALHRLQDSEPRTPSYIATRLQALRPQLQALQATLTEAQLREIASAVEQHKQYVNQPTKQPTESSQSKYYPGTCPACGVVWGDDHKNELGQGFESLGAGVWKCTHCNEIVHDLHDSNQSITKW
ncbi:hypothetical protein [Halobacterium sp. KA-6]|uniref:hypothetical protein n=1 Tax=Halobacterium sp. KA-6 TaxID=2896368 RepID=UPI001E3C02C4|nr:hypothetical protein [Halobacterium sp. KA-6]MCD2205056.1 hypothetical protein [Halobacterium sp. KA-6]